MNNKKETVQGKFLTLGELMRSYDKCTKQFMDTVVGRDDPDSSVVISGGGVRSSDCQYGYLEKYRQSFRNSDVFRLYLFADKRFNISDSDALDCLEKDRLVLLPLVEPENVRRATIPPGVANKILVTVYSHLLYTLWTHLSRFVGADRLERAAIISFQDTVELHNLRDRLAQACVQLTDVDNKSILVPIGAGIVQNLEKKYSVRG